MVEDRMIQLETEVKTLREQVSQVLLWRNAPNAKCFSAEEVARFCGCTSDTIKKYEREGKLAAKFPNAERRFAMDDVQRFMQGLAPARQAKRRKA